MRLANKTALVTGSSQGIGRAIAVRLAAEGADIVVTGPALDDQARQTAEQVRVLGRRVCLIAADLGRLDDCRRLVRESIEQMGHLDILVNNAGMEIRAPFLEVREEDYDRVMQVNLRGAFFVTQAFVRHLADGRRGGRIINTSSVHEELAFPNFTSYCMSKGGLRMMTRSLAVELAPLGITINNIAPGAIETPMNSALLHQPDKLAELLGKIPLGRLGQPQDIAGVAAFLASSDADYITGETLVVDGGLLRQYAEQ